MTPAGLRVLIIMDTNIFKVYFLLAQISTLQMHHANETSYLMVKWARTFVQIFTQI